MKWWLIFTAFASAICGLLGLTAGINLNPQATVRFVPNWGSLGDWFSGVGAFAAIGATLYLTARNEKQQADARRDRITLEQDATDIGLSLRLISLGQFPTTIRAVLIVRPDDGAVPIWKTRGVENGPKLPRRVEFKEGIQYSWALGRETLLVRSLEILQVERFEDLSVVVSTSTETFRFPLDAKFCDALRAASSGEPWSSDWE